MEAPHKYHLARKPTKLVCVVECLVRTTPGTPTIQTTVCRVFISPFKQMPQYFSSGNSCFLPDRDSLQHKHYMNIWHWFVSFSFQNSTSRKYRKWHTLIHMGEQIKEMGGACSTYGGEERCIQDFYGQIWGRWSLGRSRNRWEYCIKIDL